MQYKILTTTCRKVIKKIFAALCIVAMFALSYISVERNSTASEKLADFLCPFQKIKECRTPSLNRNSSTAQHECRTEGKAAPFFCCSHERQVTEMSYTVKTCQREKYSNLVATPTERNTVQIKIVVIFFLSHCFYLVGRCATCLQGSFCLSQTLK